VTASELYQNIFNKDWFRSCCGDFLEKDEIGARKSRGARKEVSK